MSPHPHPNRKACANDCQDQRYKHWQQFSNARGFGIIEAVVPNKRPHDAANFARAGNCRLALGLVLFSYTGTDDRLDRREVL